MSFSREGWKSQKILAQVCRDCLSKRITPVVINRRHITNVASQPSINSSTTIIKPLLQSVPGLIKTPSTTPVLKSQPQQQQQQLLESFRNELYHHNQTTTITNITKASSSLDAYYSKPRVRKAILRRESRKRILRAYKVIKKEQPALLSQITQQDFDTLLSVLTTNPDEQYFLGPGQEALSILEDLKEGRLSGLSFRTVDYEAMICLASKLKLTKRACTLLSEAKEQVGIGAFESVLHMLAFQQNKSLLPSTRKRLEFWLRQLESQQQQPTKKIIRAVVVSRLGVGQIESAANYLRQHGDIYYSSLLTRFEAVQEDRELLDHALNMFAKDCLEEWGLNDMRLIYTRKRQQGMSTSFIVKHLIHKCLHTGQLQTAQAMLSDTISLKDTTNAQLVSQKLIQWYISQKDVQHAMKIWQHTQNNLVMLDQDVMETLLVNTAKLKYHVDTIRLYQHLYPRIKTNPVIHVYVLRCMVRSKEFHHLKQLTHQVEELLPTMKSNLARSAVKSLFSLAAQTGNLELFERVFKKSEELELSLTHKGLTSLIACYLQRGDVPLAKAAFSSVASHTEGPDVVDFNLLMRTVVMEEKGVVNYNKIFDILNHMKIVGVQPDETTLRTMLGFYKSESEMQKNLYHQLLNHPQATSRFDQVYLNNIALSSLLTRLSVERVVGILCDNNRGQLFPTQQGQRIHVNGFTYKLLFDAIRRDKKLSNLYERLVQDMNARGMKPSKEIYESLIEILAFKGKIKKARKYIVKMEMESGIKADIKTYTKLVDGLIFLNKPELAKEVILDDMKEMELDEELLKRLNTIEASLSS